MPETRPYESLRAKGEDRKQRILAVAQRLLTRNGWRNTTLAQIASEAGVSPAGLLHHFESKEQLIHAVLDVRDADDDAHADRAGDLISEVAAVAERLEQKLGVGVFDSIAVTLWACLIAAGVDPSIVRGWGSVFTNSHLVPPAAASVPLRQHS